MARKEKNTVDYFPYDCDEGRKSYYIENTFGNDGVATWIKLLRTLAVTENHYFDLSDEANMMYFATRCRITQDKLNDILDALAKLGAIDAEFWQKYKVVWSQKFVNDVTDAYKRRSNDIWQRSDVLAAIAPAPELMYTETPDSGHNVDINRDNVDIMYTETPDSGHNACKSTQRKEKKRKEKETKPKEIKENQDFENLPPPIFEVFKTGFSQKGFSPPRENLEISEGADRVDLCRRVIRHFNETTGSAYPELHHPTHQLIATLLARGHTEEEIAEVVEFKTHESQRTDHKGQPLFRPEWLTPPTIFEPEKFMKYVQNVHRFKSQPTPHFASESSRSRNRGAVAGLAVKLYD